MTTALPTFLPLPEAARKYGLTEARLKAMIENGKIRAAMIGDEVVVNEDEIRSGVIRKEDLPEYKKHAHLKGVPIWISEAERKYGVPHPTILKWVKAGYIKTLGWNGNKRLIDEADIGYCSEIYKQRGKPGRILFNPDGTPYKPRTGPLAL